VAAILKQVEIVEIFFLVKVDSTITRFLPVESSKLILKEIDY